MSTLDFLTCIAFSCFAGVTVVVYFIGKSHGREEALEVMAEAYREDPEGMTEIWLALSAPIEEAE